MAYWKRSSIFIAAARLRLTIEVFRRLLRFKHIYITVASGAFNSKSLKFADSSLLPT